MEILKLQRISFIIALSTAGVTGWPADAFLLFNSIYSMFHAIHTDIELVNKIIYKQSSTIHYIQLKQYTKKLIIRNIFDKIHQYCTMNVQ